MRFLVISDSHGNYPLALKAEELAGDIDAIIHLGDGAGDALLLAQTLDIEVKMVAGNCDLGAIAPRELLFECEGHRILMVHGDRYGVKHSLDRLQNRAREVGAALALYGHTHVAAINQTSDLLLVNPGTLIKSGKHKTYAILGIDPNDIIATLHDIS